MIPRRPITEAMEASRGSSEKTLELAQRREHPNLFVVTKDFRFLLGPKPDVAQDPLPREIARVGRRLVASAPLEPGTSAVALLSDDYVLRVFAVYSEANHVHYAIIVERFAVRYTSKDAMRRFNLTKREAEVLDGLLHGNSSQKLARSLGIAETTVNEYIRNIGRKMNVRKRSEIVATFFGFR